MMICKLELNNEGDLAKASSHAYIDRDVLALFVISCSVMLDPLLSENGLFVRRFENKNIRL